MAAQAILTARNLRDDYYSVTIEYNYSGDKKKMDTKVKVHKKYWDKATRKVKANGAANVTDTNDKLAAKLKAVNEVIDALTLRNGNIPPTVAQLTAYYAQQATPAAVETEAAPTRLTTALEAYIAAATGRKGKWQPLTIKSFQTLLNVIEEYETATGEAWLMDTLTNAQVKAWQEWLMTRVIKKSKKIYKNSTLGKQVKKLKQFLNDAPTGSLNPSFDVAKVKAQHEMKVKSTIITITAKEIAQLHALSIDNPRLGRVKELFVLQCYTGLRYSDVIKIEKADIHNGFIKVQTQKTVDALNIPLFAQAKDILEKYNYDLTPLVLSLTNQNLYLKELFALPQVLEAIPTLKNKIKLNEERGTVRDSVTIDRYAAITTHVARKSFITMALQLKQPAHIVKLWSGHKSDASFSRYIDAAQGQVEAANALQDAINAL